MSRILVALAALSLVACSDQSDPSPAEPGDGSVTPAVTSPLELSGSHVPRGAHTALSGGATTVFDATAGAFSLPAPNLDARTAPAVFGLGLLEAVPAAEILALADPDDRNHDGISGRVNRVWNDIRHRTEIGRFGWKANVSTLLQQTAGAYNGDMGITSSIFPAESCEGEYPGCALHAPEVSDRTVRDVALYTETLGVPARRRLDEPQVIEGEELFHAVGCAGCHVATLVTGTVPGLRAVSRQVIHPYTDLLVHDMGSGLADDRPDFQASGSEWRTPPLWGIGLVQTVNGHTDFLHDGRARSLLEAVMWHGGEAQAARDRVQRFSADQRAALLAFLNSL